MNALKIRFDYSQIDDIAGRFRHEADEAQRALKTLARAKDELQAGEWIGTGAQAFYAEMDAAVLPAMTRLVGALVAAAECARAIRALAGQAEADAAAALRRIPAEANWAPSPIPTPKPTPPPDMPSPLATPTPTPESNPPEHGERTPLPFPIGTGIGLALSLMAKAGPRAIRSAAKSGGPLVSVAMNAIKYGAADADGSFDWSRFMIANAKDLAFSAARVPLAVGFDALAAATGAAGGATVGTLLGPEGTAIGGAMGGLGEAALAVPLSGLAAWATTVVIDSLIGDQIVDGMDDLYQRNVRPFFNPPAPRPAPVGPP
ncbi:MAG: WXG100 family type VII secretion target [Thermoflexales bacterium]